MVPVPDQQLHYARTQSSPVVRRERTLYREPRGGRVAIYGRKSHVLDVEVRTEECGAAEEGPGGRGPGVPLDHEFLQVDLRSGIGDGRESCDANLVILQGEMCDGESPQGGGEGDGA